MKATILIMTLAAAGLSAETITSSVIDSPYEANGTTIEFTAGTVQLENGANITAVNAGTVKFSGLYVHGAHDNTSTNAQITVEENSYLIGDYIKLYNDNQFTNKGTVTVDHLCLQGGTFTNCGNVEVLPIEEQAEDSFDEYGLLSISTEDAIINNYGTINGATDITGGTLNAMEGSSYGEVNIYSGATLNVKGAITLNNSLYSSKEPATICFDMTGSIDMASSSIWLDEFITIVLNVNEEVTGDTLLFKNDFFTNYRNVEGISDETVVQIKGLNNTQTTRTMGQLAVPEPTTSMLSMLAILALAVKRRRKA